MTRLAAAPPERRDDRAALRAAARALSKYS
jgi:hypothetical protein